jgi:hypothetical protein
MGRTGASRELVRHWLETSSVPVGDEFKTKLVKLVSVRFDQQFGSRQLGGPPKRAITRRDPTVARAAFDRPLR